MMGKWVIRVYIQQGIFFVLRRLWVTKVLPICHFHNSHNAPYLPPQILHNLCFPFLLGITAVPREIENNAYAKLGGGANKVHYGECGSGVFRPQGFLKMADDQTGSVRDICSKVAVLIDSNPWTLSVWLLTDHQLTDTNRYQLTNFINWYQLINRFSDHLFPLTGYPGNFPTQKNPENKNFKP